MGVLVLGLSHHSASLSLLERVALDAAGVDRLLARLPRVEAVEGAVVLATCNRLEVYAAAVTFHGALTSISELLARETGASLAELRDHLYVHYEDRAVAHVFGVAAGLDSMAVGEAQILGQLREAFRQAQQADAVTEELGALMQQALRVGKRAHNETGIDTVSHSLLGAGLDLAGRWVGPLDRAEVLVLGAGGMSGLAARTAAAAGARQVVVLSRTLPRAERIAAEIGGVVRPMSEVEPALASADVVISAAGSVGHVVTADQVARARAARGHPSGGRGGQPHPQVFLDLGMPRDVDPQVAQLPGAQVVDLEMLGRHLAEQADSQLPDAVKAVADLVTAEVAEHVTGRIAKRVAPTVTALRSRAGEVVAAELTRLDQKVPDLDEAARAQVHRTVHRIVEKLLHTPTTRIKELTAEGAGGDYEAALRELFDLDPHDVAVVSVPPTLPEHAADHVPGGFADGGDRP